MNVKVLAGIIAGCAFVLGLAAFSFCKYTTLCKQLPPGPLPSDSERVTLVLLMEPASEAYVFQVPPAMSPAPARP